MAIDPYASGVPLFGGAPSHVSSDEDKKRLQSYELYENIFRSTPGVFKLMQRGSDSAPIYLPMPRTIIESTNRFLAVDWNYFVDPTIGSTEDQTLMGSMLRSLFAREKMYSRFATQKRYGLVRGDTVWHVIGNLAKVQGTRVSVREVSPSNYFPIFDPDDSEKVIGVHLVDLVPDPSEFKKDPLTKKQAARRQTYRKIDNPDGTSSITTELTIFELAAWDDRNLKPSDLKPLVKVVPVTPLDPKITSIPVYHIPNNRIPGFHFGMSQMQGIERVIGAINQSISDEELTLALQGLGLYVSTAGPPVDGVTRAPGEWDLGPGQVVELTGPEDRFERITGVTTVAPMIEHMKFIENSMLSSLGLTDVATGDRFDVTTAESGIALYLRLAPLLTANGEKEMEMFGEYDHLFWDLVHQWFPVYEGTNAAISCEVVTIAGDPMPRDHAADVAEVVSLSTSTPPIVTIAEARTRLTKLGWDLEVDAATGFADSAKVIAEQASLSNALYPDPQNRYREELDESGAAAGGGTATAPSPTPVIPVAP
jgi:hypothetical protein